MNTPLQVWSPSANGLLLGQHAGHMGPVLCMALDGNLLFSGSQDGTIRMWDAVPPLFNGRPATAGTAAAAKHSHDNSSCCHAARDTALMVLRGHSGSVVGLAVAAESGVLVSCGADGLVLQWDVSTGQQLGRCCLEGQVPACVAVEPDTRQVYVGTSQGQLLTIAGTEQVCAAHLQLVGCSSSP
jgi:WD40 repeat protein